MTIKYKTIKEIKKMISKKEISNKEVVQEVYRLINENSHLNAFVTLNEESSIKKAQDLDNNPSDYSLAGIPSFTLNGGSVFSFSATGTSAGFDILIVSDVDGNVIALNQVDGSKLWSTNVQGEVLSRAAIDAKVVVVKTNSGELIGLDKSDGNIIWSYRSKLPLLTIRGSSSPVIEDNLIYASFDNGRLGVFELASGFQIWDGAISYVRGVSELENLIDSDSDPVVDSGLIYTTNYQGNINIFDTSQRRSIWNYETSSFYSPLISRGMMAVVETDSTIRAFALKTLQESWVSDEYLNRELSNAVNFKGSLVVGDFEGHIHIIDLLNGRTLSRKKVSKKPIKTIFSRSDSLYVVDEAFNLISINI